MLTYQRTIVFFLSGFVLAECPAHAALTFPYSNRTKDYSSWSPAAQSDTNTTGLAGATVALPQSISSAEVNPAGFAMETGSLSAQINHISVVDKRIQPDGNSIDSLQYGLGVSPPPWGFSIAYYSPITESDTYNSPLTLVPNQTEVSLKELRFTVAHTLLNSRLAIGISGELDKAVREIGGYSYDSYATSFAVGALFRAYEHIILGVSYIPPLTIGPASNQPDNPLLPGFNRAVLRPSQINLGLGWQPNRFFKLGMSVSYIGSTANTALLEDQSIVSGATPTFVPRIGESYILAQFNNFQSELALGSYYASSRLEGETNQLHATAGWDINPYFVNIGLGFDLASNYRNIMIGVGVDIVRTLRTFHIIPADPTPPYNGFFPQPQKISADGLPDAMTRGEQKTSSPPTVGDVSKIVQEAPENLVKEVTGKPTTVDVKAKQDEAAIGPPVPADWSEKHPAKHPKGRRRAPKPKIPPSPAQPSAGQSNQGGTNVSH